MRCASSDLATSSPVDRWLTVLWSEPALMAHLTPVPRFFRGVYDNSLAPAGAAECAYRSPSMTAEKSRTYQQLPQVNWTNENAVCPADLA